MQMKPNFLPIIIDIVPREPGIYYARSLNLFKIVSSPAANIFIFR